jgi:hypothetical protein
MKDERKIKRDAKIAISIAIVTLSILFVFVGIVAYYVITDVPPGYSPYSRRLEMETPFLLEVTREDTTNELIREVTKHINQLEDVIALNFVGIRFEEDFQISRYDISYIIRLSENSIGFLSLHVILDNDEWQIRGGEVRYMHTQRQINNLLTDDVTFFIEEVIDYLKESSEHLIWDRATLSIWYNSISFRYGMYDRDVITFDVNREGETPVVKRRQ